MAFFAVQALRNLPEAGFVADKIRSHRGHPANDLSVPPVGWGFEWLVVWACASRRAGL